MRSLVLLVGLAMVVSGCVGDDADDNGDGASPQSFDPSGSVCESTTGDENASAPVWVLETSMGSIRVTLFCDKTPKTAQNIVNLTEDGYYDGQKFHRVIRDFMNQGGDPKTKNASLKDEWGTGGPGYTIPDEFYCADGTVDPLMDNPQYASYPLTPGRSAHAACGGALGLKHDEAGVVSMANSGPESGGSQFFITARATPHLDGAHPIFGKVVDQSSLDVVLSINTVETDGNDRPVSPVSITSATMEWP